MTCIAHRSKFKITFEFIISVVSKDLNQNWGFAALMITE